MAPWEVSDLLNPELSLQSARLQERRRTLHRNIFGVGCSSVPSPRSQPSTNDDVTSWTLEGLF